MRITKRLVWCLLVLCGTALAQCSQGNSWADGCPGAPSGSIQYATAFSGATLRPPWNVPGVDYYVGIPSGTSLSDWRTLSVSGVAVNTSTGAVTCSSAGTNVTINAVDFSLGVQGFINDPAGSCHWTITRSKFTCPHNLTANIIADSVDFEFNDIDQAGCTTDHPSAMMQGAGVSARHLIIRYNWFKHSYQHLLETGVPGYLDMNYNLIDDMLPDGATFGQHENWVQWFTPSNGQTVQNVDIGYNFSYHHTSGTGNGEGYQWYSDNGTMIYTNTVTMHNNTIVTLAGTGMSNIINAGGPLPPAAGAKPQSTFQTVHNDYNYFNTIATPYYLGTVTTARGWSSTCNIDMATGLKILPDDNSESSAAGCPTSGGVSSTSALAGSAVVSGTTVIK